MNGNLKLHIMEFLRNSVHQGKAFKTHSCFAVEGPSGSEPLWGTLLGTVLVSHGVPGPEGEVGMCRR